MGADEIPFETLDSGCALVERRGGIVPLWRHSGAFPDILVEGILLESVQICEPEDPDTHEITTLNKGD